MAERMDHDKMKRASELPIEGPAATETLAASGGLELPGRAAKGVTAEQKADLEEARRDVPPTVASIDRLEGQDPDVRWRSRSDASPTTAPPKSETSPLPARQRDEDPGDASAARLEPIPGEHDRTTAMSSQPGILGTTGYGGDTTPGEDSTVDEELAERARWEAGGRIAPHRTK